MATTFIDFDQQTAVGRKITRSLQMLRESRDVLRDAIAVMATMVDGNGSDISHFALAVTEVGFPNTTQAKAAWDELQSLNYIVNKTDGDAAGAAITQACAKHGV